jgi:hypothetical protein
MNSLAATAGRFSLAAQWQRAGRDLMVLVTGGDAPHLGAVAMAEPRPSLADPSRTSATVSVFCYPGHKEDELARELAQALAAALGVKVVVAAGMHWDGLTAADIAQVRAAHAGLKEMLIATLCQGNGSWPSAGPAVLTTG